MAPIEEGDLAVPIVMKIEEYVAGIGSKEGWYVGITKNPDRRKSEHEREKGITCEHFKYWDAFCSTLARRIEKLLEKKGFSIHEEDLKIIASEDPKKEQKYVYVYKAVKKK